MPKPRTIDAGFFDDPDIANLSRNERLLLVGMISTCADDEGRLMADPGYLRKKVFGYDDDVTKAEVQEWRDTIVSKCRNVRMYVVAGQFYLWLVNWIEYQSIRYIVGSKLPAYSEDCDVSRTDDLSSSNLPQSPVNSPRVRVNVGLGLSSVEQRATQAAALPKEKKAVAKPVPDEYEPSAEIVLAAKKKYPRMDIQAATEGWLQAMHSNRTKYRYTDFDAAWWTGMARADEWGWHRKGQGNGHGTNQASIGRVQIQKTKEGSEQESFVPGLADELAKLSSRAKGA